MESQWLKAGEFSRRSRLSPKALRLYAANGILVPDQVDVGNGYRNYHESQLTVARMVRLLRRLDMPLTLVAKIVEMPREERAQHIATYWTDIERNFVQRQELVSHLTKSLSGGKDIYPMYKIDIREVPEQRVLTEQAYVSATSLQEWIVDAGSRQLREAAKIGGQTGPSLVIYHGEVSEDSDGPVEMCIPISPKMEMKTSQPTRIEPAHREVYTTITREQVRFPDIVSAYDAVERWISDNNATICGSPREIYFADPSSGDGSEPVADIAFPIK